MPAQKSEKSRFRSVSSHVEDLADGRTVPPGEFIELTDDELQDPHNLRLLQEGVLMRIEEDKDTDADAKTETKKEGRN